MKRKMDDGTADDSEVSVSGVDHMLVDNGHGSEGATSSPDLDKLFLRASPFASETGPLPLGEFEPGEELKEFLRDDVKVLVIGAGGLGCELLKDLALSGCGQIVVIDLDTIELSNLNRQFLFRHKDVGRPKAVVAAEFINARVPWVKVEAHHCKIQDFDADFYQQFNLVVAGLDNVEARRWLNSMMCSLVEVDEDGNIDPSTIIPMVDGGTEGFKGQARVILPRLTSCFECSLDMFPPQRVYPMCTIAETPRLPEHCISYAFLLLWPEAFKGKKLDKDNPEHLKWVYERALERAQVHKIRGVTYSLTMGVVRNIIPAVASTNAVIAAACANEALKLVTYASQTMNTYMMYMGATAVYGNTFKLEKKDECAVCGSKRRNVSMARTAPLGDLVEYLKSSDLRLRAPSLTHPKATLYMQNPPALRKQTEPNLKKPLEDLMEDGDEVTVTDPVYNSMHLVVTVNFQP